MFKTKKVRANNLARFVPGAYYHVYNRTNNRELLFRDDADRRFFLKQYIQFVVPYVDTYAYCLLPDHFHLAICIKPAPVLLSLAEQTPEQFRTVAQQKILLQIEEPPFHPLVERQFTRMFTAYATHINLRYRRKGNLFYRPFKRIAADNDDYLTWLLYYIHQNPRKHHIMHDFTQYVWSSYPALISAKPTNLARASVINMFGSREHFIAFHTGEEPCRPQDWNLEIE